MTLKEIHNEEIGNSDRIIFRKEGLFWKAFERSAFLLHLKGHDYKVMWMNSKELPVGVVRVGTSVDPLTLFPECHVIEKTEERIVLEAGVSFTDAMFFEWRQRMIDNTISMVRKPRKEKRKVIEDPAMHRALEEMAEEGASLAGKADIGPVSDAVWKDDVIDRIRSFDASSSVMQDFVMLVFSLKEAVSAHDRKETAK